LNYVDNNRWTEWKKRQRKTKVQDTSNSLVHFKSKSQNR
jgi:hypothetical protein